MARLPEPGGDVDAWAEILNEYLLVAHNPDGSQRFDSVPPHSVEFRDLDVKNPVEQPVANLVLTNDSERLVWKDPGEVLRAASHLTINVSDFGAIGDGIADDTAAFQAAIDTAENGGTIEIPRGTYRIRSLKIKRHGITLTGEARWGTRLVRHSGHEPLIDLSGTISMDGHLKYCSMFNLTLNGNYDTGVLIRSYYADNFVFRDVSFTHSDGQSIDFVEVWDTRFYGCTWEDCGSLNEPAILFRNSTDPGTFGYSQDNTNQIHFLGCRWESWRNGAVRLDGGANGSPNLLNGIFFVSCKIESRFAAGPALQIMTGTTLVFVNQLYIAIMAAEPDLVKPLDAIDDWGSHIFMTDVYVQWGSEVQLANSLVHIRRSGPHMYYKLSTYYPLSDPVEAAVVVEPGSTDVVVSCNITNRGRQIKGDASSVMLSSPSKGMVVPLDNTGVVRITSNVTNKDLVKIDNNVNRPALHTLNGVDSVGFSDNYTTEKWRIVGSTGAARFAGGKFQIEGTKGYVGINTTPFTGTAMLIKAAVEGDKGLSIVRPTASATNRLMEFQDETYNIQGTAFDSHGRLLAVGTPSRVTAGEQASYANPRVPTRDIAGSITAAIRPTPTAPGTVATVTFSRPFLQPPVSIVLYDHSLVSGDLYVSARSEAAFTIATRSALRGGQLLNFDYQIVA